MMLPIIDFSSKELKPGTSTWESVKVEVKTALEGLGCFHALCDQDLMETRKKLSDLLPKFFDQPLEDKARNNPDKIHRYLAPGLGRPLYESISIKEATLPTNIDNFTSSIWPQGNSEFSKTVECHVDFFSKLDETIRMMVLESFGLEKYKEEHMDSTENFLVFHRYKPRPNTVTDVGLISHTDKNIVTILDQFGIDALEVQKKDDDKWIKVNFYPNSLFVLIGESFHAWTNGRLYPPHHRVTMIENEVRYTIGLFSTPKPGYMLKAPEEVVDENHPQLYKPYDFAGLDAFFNEVGYKYKCCVKAYVGV